MCSSTGSHNQSNPINNTFINRQRGMSAPAPATVDLLEQVIESVRPMLREGPSKARFASCGRQRGARASSPARMWCSPRSCGWPSTPG